MPLALGEWARSVAGSDVLPRIGPRLLGSTVTGDGMSEKARRTAGRWLLLRVGVQVERGHCVKLKSAVTLLVLVGLLFSEPVYAAKITIGDQGGFVDVDAIAQTWVRITENGNAAHTGVSTEAPSSSHADLRQRRDQRPHRHHRQHRRQLHPGRCGGGRRHYQPGDAAKLRPFRLAHHRAE